MLIIVLLSCLLDPRKLYLNASLDPGDLFKESYCSSCDLNRYLPIPTDYTNDIEQISISSYKCNIELYQHCQDLIGM